MAAPAPPAPPAPPAAPPPAAEPDLRGVLFPDRPPELAATSRACNVANCCCWDGCDSDWYDLVWGDDAYSYTEPPPPPAPAPPLITDRMTRGDGVVFPPVCNSGAGCGDAMKTGGGTERNVLLGRCVRGGGGVAMCGVCTGGGCGCTRDGNSEPAAKIGVEYGVEYGVAPPTGAEAGAVVADSEGKCTGVWKDAETVGVGVGVGDAIRTGNIGGGVWGAELVVSPDGVGEGEGDETEAIDTTSGVG